ncbi:MAG: phosphoribosylglycinamide formyltransferase-1 [Saprospiraceae bacterium]
MKYFFNNNLIKLKRVAIFASGTGSNAKKIVEHFQGHPDIEISLVVSNNQDAKVLDMAHKYNIPTLVVNKSLLSTSDYILEKFSIFPINFIVLAGFLLLIPKYLVDKFPNRIVNIHPALLPKFGGKGMYGMNVHKAVKESGEKESGITIHYVNEKYDEGSTILQASCPVLAEDSPEDIAKNVLRLEHEHFAMTIERVLNSY